MIKNILEELYKQNIQSVIIEGGSKTLQSFIDTNMWDEARIFTTNKELTDGVKSPNIEGKIISEKEIGGDRIRNYYAMINIIYTILLFNILIIVFKMFEKYNSR